MTRVRRTERERHLRLVGPWGRRALQKLHEALLLQIYAGPKHQADRSSSIRRRSDFARAICIERRQASRCIRPLPATALIGST